MPKTVFAGCCVPMEERFNPKTGQREMGTPAWTHLAAERFTLAETGQIDGDYFTLLLANIDSAIRGVHNPNCVRKSYSG